MTKQQKETKIPLVFTFNIKAADYFITKFKPINFNFN